MSRIDGRMFRQEDTRKYHYDHDYLRINDNTVPQENYIEWMGKLSYALIHNKESDIRMGTRSVNQNSSSSSAIITPTMEDTITNYHPTPNSSITHNLSSH